MVGRKCGVASFFSPGEFYQLIAGSLFAKHAWAAFLRFVSVGLPDKKYQRPDADHEPDRESHGQAGNHFLADFCC